MARKSKKLNDVTFDTPEGFWTLENMFGEDKKMGELHNITVKDDVYDQLKTIRFALSTEHKVLTFNEAVAEVLKVYNLADKKVIGDE